MWELVCDQVQQGIDDLIELAGDVDEEQPEAELPEQPRGSAGEEQRRAELAKLGPQPGQAQRGGTQGTDDFGEPDEPPARPQARRGR